MTKLLQGTLAPDTVVAFLGDIFARRGGEEYLGEAVTMAEHMLQGAHLAEQAGEEDVIVVAALLHDVGHFTSEFGAFAMDDTHDKRHEQAGAEVLKRFFPSIVIDCISGHVAAKRYLCAIDPELLRTAFRGFRPIAATSGWADEPGRGRRIRKKPKPRADRTGSLPLLCGQDPRHGHARVRPLRPHAATHG